jgi:hypothetical protein
LRKTQKPEKKEAREKLVIAAHIDTANSPLEKVRNTIKKAHSGGVMAIAIIFEIEE